MNNQVSSDLEQHFQPIATFILKTFAILSSPENAQTIAWHQDGTCFYIKDVQKMVKEVLPRYFRHHKYQSFIRQLNMYNFSKVKSSDGPCFANQYFRQGRDDMLKFIKRKPQRKKRKNQEKEQMIKQEQKENVIKMISQSNFPTVKKQEIFQQEEPIVNFTKVEVLPVRRGERKVTFAEDIPDVAEQNLSTMMEPSRKWLNSKEESCWQNIKSSKSIKFSMQLLSLDDQEEEVQSKQSVFKRKISGSDSNMLKYLTQN